MEGNVCSCSHHKVVPFMIVLIGLAFLLQALGIIGSMLVAFLWPVFLIIAGLAKLGSRGCRCCAS